MKKGSKLLVGAVIIAGAVDLYMANRVYLKKKGVVLRDMILASLEDRTRGRSNEDAQPDAADGEEETDRNPGRIEIE